MTLTCQYSVCFVNKSHKTDKTEMIIFHTGDFKCTILWVIDPLWGIVQLVEAQTYTFILMWKYIEFQKHIKILSSVEIYIINYSQRQREFSTSVLKTVNHRTTLDSHIPDFKPRVKNSAAQNRVSKAMQRSVRDDRERAPNTSPASFTEPFFSGHKSACCVTQDMQDTLSRATKPIETKSINFNKELISYKKKKVRGVVKGGGEKKKQNGFKEHSKSV